MHLRLLLIAVLIGLAGGAFYLTQQQAALPAPSPTMTVETGPGPTATLRQIRLTTVPEATLVKPLIPPFIPAHPCELENVDVYVEDACYTERVTERLLLSGSDVIILERDEYVGSGCLTGISYDQYYLQSCNQITGERTPLLESEGSFTFYPSPDGSVMVFSTFNFTNGTGTDAHLYRINADGSGLHLLSTQGLPKPYISAWAQGWIGSEWMLAYLWDGSQTDAFRFRVDGSGDHERLGPVGTPLPVWTP